MDFLAKAYSQLIELLRSMTIGARITAALLLAVVVVSLVFLFKWQTPGPEVDLMHGLSVPAGQLPAMEAAFNKGNLNGYEVRGTQIFVPRGQQAKYMAALADAKVLPPNFGSALREAINAGNAFESSKAKEQRIKYAIQDELSLIIGSMPGMENAYVFYDTDKKPGFSQEKISTASVTVKPVGDRQIDEEAAVKIRMLVASAIAGLKPECVTVTDINGRVFRGGSSGDGGTEDNPYFAQKRRYEQSLKKQILESLAYVPNVTVEPSVVLDRDRKTVSRKVQVDPKTVPIRETNQSATKSQTSAAPAGRPGLEAQQPNRGMTLSVQNTGAKQDEETSNQEVISDTSKEQIERETVGLTPKRVTVSIGIPSSYFEKVWRERNPTEEGQQPKNPERAALDTIRQEESAKIQKSVAILLPPVEGVADLSELVTVTAFQDIKPAKIPEPAMTDHALAWLGQYWTTLGVIVLVLISLLMLRSMIRSAPAPAPATAASLPAIYNPQQRSDEPESAAAETAAQKRLRRFHGSGKSLRDELSDLVKEDPDVAANILKSWIGHVG
jgi:flagellar M-ring protein FliF